MEDTLVWFLIGSNIGLIVMLCVKKVPFAEPAPKRRPSRRKKAEG